MSTRIAVAATGLTLSFVLAIGGLSYTVTRGQLIKNQDIALESQAYLYAHEIGNTLRSIVTTLGTLPENALILNALMDSLTRQTALVPFLKDFSRINEVPVTLLVTDFEGQPIAGNGELALEAHLWQRPVLESGQPYAVIGTEADGDYLFVAEPIFYSRTLSPEGALLYRVALAQVKAALPRPDRVRATLRLVYPKQGAVLSPAAAAFDNLRDQNSLSHMEMLPVPAVLQPLGLAAEVSMDRTRLNASLSRLLLFYATVGTGVMLAVFALARVGADYLTRPLRELETVTRSVIESGSLEHRFVSHGVFEIERLGIAFNQMLEQLDGAHRQLQRQAETEAERNRALAAANTTLAREIGERERAEATLAQTIEELRVAERRQGELLAVTRREQGRLRALLAAMNVGILFEDHQQRVEYLNPAFLKMWAIDATLDLIGQPTREILERATRRLTRPDPAWRSAPRLTNTPEISARHEIDLDDGRILTQMAYPVVDHEDHLLGRMWLFEDITHERQTAQQLLYLAERDSLTGLYNRHSFQKCLDQKMAAARRGGDCFALIYFDLDEFKAINDTFGHRAGDMVLVRTAGEIATQVRATEMFARLGGDEFAILSTLGAGHEAGTLPARIVETISAIPLRFRGTNLRLTASVGVALFPDHGENMEDLVAHADTAMYQAKQQGKNTCALYDPGRDSTEVKIHRLNWNNRITQALDADLFELNFQGVYHIKDNTLSHLEVLVRMRNPDVPARLILPGQFIPLAEKSGQVLDIDRWVLQQSIARLGQHPGLPPLAVNLSGRTFDDPTLPQFIQRLLAEHNVAPQRLFVELTETAAVSDVQDAQRFIEAIQEMGCGVCLDDFGSGFSTFAYLKYLDVKVLKIDGLFVRDLPNNPDNQVFIRAMVEVARGLGKTTVAEFVEDAATLDMLRILGVDFAQGFYLDRPVAKHPALAA